jgi:hypothetical protein
MPVGSLINIEWVHGNHMFAVFIQRMIQIKIFKARKMPPASIKEKGPVHTGPFMSG